MTEPVFDEREVDGLPEIVQRYLRGSIAPGTPLVRGVRLTLRGRIRLGRWWSFDASQTLDPHRGFVWSARVAHRTICGSDADMIGVGTRAVSFDRWGDPDDTGDWAWQRFGGELGDPRTFGGISIPTTGHFGWFPGGERWDDGEFLRFEVKSLDQRTWADPGRWPRSSEQSGGVLVTHGGGAERHDRPQLAVVSSAKMTG